MAATNRKGYRSEPADAVCMCCRLEVHVFATRTSASITSALAISAAMSAWWVPPGFVHIVQFLLMYWESKEVTSNHQ